MLLLKQVLLLFGRGFVKGHQKVIWNCLMNSQILYSTARTPSKFKAYLAILPNHAWPFVSHF